MQKKTASPQDEEPLTIVTPIKVIQIEETYDYPKEKQIFSQYEQEVMAVISQWRGDQLTFAS